MREIPENMDFTIQRVKLLAGVPVKIKVNHGRNKIELFEGKIESVYPKIFTVRKEDGDLTSYSYSDVLSKNICFFRSEK